MPPVWSCVREGSCCREPPTVLMTHEERAAIEAVTDRRLVWLTHPSPRFVELQAQPCPLLDMDGDVAVCTVYAVRPYNCRRMACGRRDVTTDPYETEPIVPALGMTGCRSLSQRLTESLDFQEWYRSNQRRAQREWAEAHGWDRSLT